MEPHSPIVGVVGRLELEKGHPTLLEAWPHVLRSVPDAYLIIVGEGSRLDALHDIARDMRMRHRVVFTGRRDDIPAVTAAFDVAVLPSYREAQGLTILEAMALSRPVVASNVGGIPEMINDGVTGLLVPPHDPPALAAAIVRLLRGPPARGHARPRRPRPRPRPVLRPADGQGGPGPLRRGRPRDPAPRGRRGRRLIAAPPVPSGAFRGAAPRSIGCDAALLRPRLWVVIALALPALLSLLVAMPAVDLAYQVRAGDEILASGALPGRGHVDVHDRGEAVARPAVAGAGHALGGARHRGLGAARRAAGRARRHRARAAARALRERDAPVARAPSSCSSRSCSPRRRSRFGRSCSPSRCSARCCGSSRPAGGAPAVPRDARPRRPVGEHPRELRARAAHARLRVARRRRHKRPWRRSLAELVVGTAATLVNPFGIGAWTYAANIGTNPRHRGHGQRVAAHVAAHGPGRAVLRVAGRHRRVPRAQTRKGRVGLSDWLWVAAGASVGGVGRARARLVAVRGGVRGRHGDRAPHATRASRAAAGPGATQPAERRRRGRARRGHRPRAAVVAAVGPADGPRGAAVVRAVGLAQSLAAHGHPAPACSRSRRGRRGSSGRTRTRAYFLDSRFELFPTSVFTVYGVIAQGGDPALAQLDGLGVGAVIVAPDSPLVGDARRRRLARRLRGRRRHVVYEAVTPVV